MRARSTLGLLACLSAGCTPYELIEVEGQTREYLVHVPAGEAPDQGWPLVVAYHGALSTPEATEDYTKLSELADAEGFVVIYPKGKSRLWNDGRMPDNHDDVAFTDALIDHAISELEVDGRRVYATGISNGAFMSLRVGCELADRVAAIAPVAGTLSEELAEVCDPPEPVAVMIFMGTEDHLVPHAGGELGGSYTAGGFGTMMSAGESAEHWAGLNGCVGAPELSQLDDLDEGTSIETTRYRQCEAEVVLHSIRGGGHSWPGAEFVVGLGPVSAELDASVEMWRFFANHTR